jgi:hypothetical protein
VGKLREDRLVVATTKQIVERLIEAVPPPRSASPHPQASWAQLKEGDTLLAPDNNSRELGSQELWVVTSVTSEGVTLASGDNTIQLTDRQWKQAGWRKLGKRELARLGENR